MKLLPLGSVVKLKNGEQKIMITVRLPMYNNKEQSGILTMERVCFQMDKQIKKRIFSMKQILMKYILKDT
jgi:hypothetical protein